MKVWEKDRLERDTRSPYRIGSIHRANKAWSVEKFVIEAEAGAIAIKSSGGAPGRGLIPETVGIVEVVVTRISGAEPHQVCPNRFDAPLHEPATPGIGRQS
jgi:hypothetical protein